MQIKFGVPPKPVFVLSPFLSLDDHLPESVQNCYGFFECSSVSDRIENNKRLGYLKGRLFSEKQHQIISA
jgi:hypothetical protein